MLKRLGGMLCVLAFTALVGLACDDSSGAKTGTGGSIGGGTGGTPGGSGGASTGTGGASGATGGTSGATGGTSGATGGTSGATGGTSGATGGAGGSAQTPMQIHTGIINAPAATGVTTLDPSIAGTPKTYNNGVCQ